MIGLELLERRALATKLSVGFLVLIALALTLGLGDLTTQRTLLQQINQLYEQDLLGVSNAKDAQAAYLTMGRELRQALIAEEQYDRAAALRRLAEQDRALRREIEELRPRILRPGVQQRLARFEAAYAIYRGNIDQALDLLQRGDLLAARTYVASEGFQSTGDAVRARIQEVVSVKEDGARLSRVEALKVVEDAYTRTWILLGTAALLGGLISWLVAASIRRPALRLRDAVQQLAQGHLTVDVPHLDYGNELGALARSVQVLQHVAQQMENQRWLKSHLSQIAGSLQSAAAMDELADVFFNEVTAIAGFGRGALYVYEEDTFGLRRLGDPSCRDPGPFAQHVGLGAGPVGQCALQRKPLALSQPSVSEKRSVDEHLPSPTSLLPLLRGERLLGVLALTTSAQFGDREQTLLDTLTPILAMNLEILERAARSNTLLAETRTQAQTLRDQAAVLQRQAGEQETQRDAIQALEAWYRSIIESAPDGLLVLDGQGRIMLSNPQVEMMFGHSAGELAGQPIEVLVPQSGRGNHVDLRSNFARTGKARIMGAGGKRLHGLRKDGTEFPVEVGLARLPDVGGRGNCVCASVRDVTDRVRVERELAKSAQRLNLALRGGMLGLWDWDVATGRSHVNEIWAEMLGYTLEEVSDDGNAAPAWERLLHPDDSPSVLERFARCIEDPQEGEFQALFRMRSKDGSWRWILSIGRATERDQRGYALRFVGIHQDFTERKQLQDEMAQAKQVAEEATKAKSSFLANMSHEIRTPMNAIIGMSHLALQAPLDKKQRNYIEKVHRAGENLLGIINDILDFSKIEAGRMDLEVVDFHLEDVMDNLASLVGMKAEEKQLELLFSIDEQVPTALRGDPLRLGQILINLGNNAVKFTAEGEVVVGVETVFEDADEVELHFWIKDTGIGMTPEQCGRMFESFSQADASTTRRYGGTGLGLAISKNLVELMQGRIWVDSVEGQGSTFHFHVRFGVQAQPRPRRMYVSEELAGTRVLVVDDNASAREILARMAASFGLQVDTASNGQEALRMAARADKQQVGYDVVLMDWKMPKMGGLEAMRRLGAEHYQRPPKVIMVTAYGRGEAIEAAEGQGLTPGIVLTKPLASSTLLEALAEALGKGKVVETRASEKAGAHAAALAQLVGARLLLVEDNDLNQELALDLLRGAGIEVVCAENGQAALDTLARDADFDGVLMDCQMPVMDGYAATEAIRANPAWSALPVIAMTANAMAGDREKAFTSGMCDHISKPLRVAVMFNTIAKWVHPAAHRSGAAVGVLPAMIAVPAAEAGGLPVLPGIDTLRGLTTTQHKHALYRRLLLKFRAGQRQFGERFSEALMDADPAAARREAHTLKGTAASIGAVEVEQAAAALEAACEARHDATTVDTALARVLRALGSVLSGLDRLAGEDALRAAATPALALAEGAPSIAVDSAELRRTLVRLSKLLARGDAEAADLAEELTSLAEGTPQSEDVRRVSAALADYDFDAAQAALNQMATFAGAE